MKLSFLFFILYFSFNISSAQLFVNTNKHNKFEVGLEPSLIAIVTKDRITFDKEYFFIPEINPFCYYYPFNNVNISLGIKTNFMFLKSNLISKPSLFGIGPSIKYIHHKRLKYNFFNKIRFFSEISLLMANYSINDNTPTYEFKLLSFSYPDKYSNLNFSNLYVNIGAIINIKKGFNINVYGQYVNFLQGSSNFTSGVSFSYMFKEKNKNVIIDVQKNVSFIEKKEIKEESKEKNNFLFNNLTAGSSLTYIWNSNVSDYPVGKNFYEEYTWNLNIATSINKRIMAGFQVLNIFTSGTHVNNENYLMYGFFSQFDFFSKKKVSLFAELSINRGDYCTCGHIDPYRKNNIWYMGFGGGLEVPIKTISENLFLDLSWINYQILNKIKTKYNFTQYIIGLNYHIGKKKK